MADDTHSRGYRNDPYGRDGTGASGQSTDPLTELARLIGQSDPFATGGGRDRRPDARPSEPPASQAWPGEESANPHHYQDQHAPAHDPRAPAYDGHGGTSEPQHHADDGYAARETYPADGGHASEPYDQGHGRGYGDQQFHDDRSYQAGQHAAPAAAAYDAPFRDHGDRQGQGYEAPYFGANEHGPGQDDEFYEDEPAPRRRGGLITVAALVGLAVIGSAGAFAYRTVFTGPGGAPPVIRSDGGPNKIVPATQNADSGTSKQIYDRMVDRGQNERVVSREEQPISIPLDPARNPRVAAPASGAPALPGGPPQTADTSALAPAQAGAGEPKKIRTVTIKADQPGEPARPATPSRSAAPPAAPAQRAPAPASPNAPLSLAPQDLASAAAPPPQAVRPSPAAPPPQAVRPSPPPQVARTSPPPPRPPAASETHAGGGYFVQLTAQKTEEEAQSSFRGIQAKYASVLSGRQPVIRRKDLGSRGVFYGAQVGPFSREDAAQLCDSLKSAGASCMVQRN